MRPAWLTSTKSLNRIWIPVLVTFLLGACATIGTYEIEDLENAAVTALPAGSSAYFYVNPRTGEFFLEELAALSGGDLDGVARLFEKADGIYLAATPPVSGPADWTLIAVGRFPVAAYSAALDFDGGWKRVRGAGRRWVSPGAGYELAFPSSQVVVAGRRDVQPTVELLRKRGPLPDISSGGFYELLSQETRRGLVGQIGDLGSFLPFELPPEFFSGTAATVAGDFVDGGLALELTLRFSSAAKARVSGLVIKTLILAEVRKRGSVMFENARTLVEAESVTIGPVRVEPEDVAGYLKRAIAGEVETR